MDTIIIFVFVAGYSIMLQRKNDTNFINSSGIDKSQKFDSDNALDAQLIDD